MLKELAEGHVTGVHQMVTDESEIKSAGRGPGGSRKEFILSAVGSRGSLFQPGSEAIWFVF